MHARVTTLEVPPDRMDDATRHVQEQVLPRLSQMEGFRGFMALGSSQSGKLQGVHAKVRAISPRLGADRYWADEMAALQAAVLNGEMDPGFTL